jgi:predicted enzyme related to lactoylglutathione lyase
MERVTGIGGVFFRSPDPDALKAWYAEHLGVEEYGETVWAPFANDTDYFGSTDQPLMINYRVANLDAMLSQLRAAGIEVVDDVQEMDGIGRFGWAVDPEGHRFELWEPAPAS